MEDRIQIENCECPMSLRFIGESQPGYSLHMRGMRCKSILRLQMKSAAVHVVRLLKNAPYSQSIVRTYFSSTSSSKASSDIESTLLNDDCKVLTFLGALAGGCHSSTRLEQCREDNERKGEQIRQASKDLHCPIFIREQKEGYQPNRLAP